MSNDTETEDRQVRPFAAFLQEHNNGVGHTQASEALQRLALAVVDTGKKGAVTIKVSVEPMKGAEGTLVTTVVVDEKLPVNPPKAAVFYADGDGNMTRTDPNQPVIEGLREVGQTEVRTPRAAQGGDR